MAESLESSQPGRERLAKAACQEARAAVMAAPSLLRIPLSDEHLTRSKIQDAHKQTAARGRRINMETPRDAREAEEQWKPRDPLGPGLNSRAGRRRCTLDFV